MPVSRKYGEIVDVDTGELIARLDEFGREVPYGGPVALAVDLVREDTLAIMIRRLVHSELTRLQSDLADVDTPEEADDFNIEDDPLDPLTPYEEQFMPRDAPREGVSDGESADRIEQGGVAGGRGRSGAGSSVGEVESRSDQGASDSGGVSEARGGRTGASE